MSRQADRDFAMAPLCAAVEANVVRAEVVSPRELTEATVPDASVKRALPSDNANVFVMTLSLHNAGGKTLVGVQSALEARHLDASLPQQLCWVDVGTQAPIEAASCVEIRSKNPAQQVSPQERAFIAERGRYSVTGIPNRVAFADGIRLDSGL